MKTLIVLLIAVVLVAVLIACARKTHTDPSESVGSNQSETGDVFADLDGLDLIFALQEKISKKEAVSGWSGLSDPERIFVCVEDVEAEVNNGGFHQYFFNSAGDHAQEASAAFEAIGARHTARIVRDACAVFPDGQPPEIREERQELLEQLGEDALSRLGELDDSFYEYQDNIEELLVKFVRANQSAFG